MSACRTAKTRYRTRDSAENVLRQMTRSRKWIRRVQGGYFEVRVYECPYCKGWHLTSQLPDPAGDEAPDLRIRGRRLEWP